MGGKGQAGLAHIGLVYGGLREHRATRTTDERKNDENASDEAEAGRVATVVDSGRQTRRTTTMTNRPPIQMAPGSTTSGKTSTRPIMDETEYLLSSPANARRLLESVNEINSLVDALGGSRKEPAE